LKGRPWGRRGRSRVKFNRHLKHFYKKRIQFFLINVDMFWMVYCNGLLHELVGGGLDIYGGDLLGVMVNEYQFVLSLF
jgi:hypothetical protein